MDREELYNDENAYEKLINWPGIAKIVGSFRLATAFSTPFVGTCNLKAEENDDIKKKNTYSFSYDQIGSTETHEDNCFRFILESSNNYKLTINYAKSLLSNDEIAISYKLGDKELTFYISLTVDKKYNYSKMTFSEIENVKIAYDGLTFSKSLLNYRDELLNYCGSNYRKEADRVLELHKNLINKLINSTFNTTELNMFYENLHTILFNQSIKAKKDIDRILRSMKR